MVIQEDDGEAPMEMSIVKPVSETKTFVIVKNHVREVPVCLDSVSKDKSSNNVGHGPEDSAEKCRKRSSKSLKKQALSRRHSHESKVSSSDITKIDDSDLQELKTVYKKCKAVVEKIERKYGHLLDINETLQSCKRDNNSDTGEDETEECSCIKNKKVVFSDDGTTSIKESERQCHVCPKKVKSNQSNDEPFQPHLQLEYDTDIQLLPDSLTELGNILRDPSISKTYRNKVIHKYKLTRQEHINDIRFNKDFLKEKLKANPDEWIEFKGSNLGSLGGYK